MKDLPGETKTLFFILFNLEDDGVLLWGCFWVFLTGKKPKINSTPVLHISICFPIDLSKTGFSETPKHISEVNLFFIA